MTRLLPYRDSLWLCEPSRLQRLAVRAAAVPTCPTPRELVESRRVWQERASTIAETAIQAGGTCDPDEMDKPIRLEMPEARSEAPRAIRAVKGKIGVIPIYGPVDQRMTGELEKAGGTPLDYVSAAFDNLLNNPAVGAIVLHIDSPGGATYGTQELSDKIYNARGEKAIYTMADSMMASAALWFGTSASMVICTPGGDVGSHGVYALHVDESKALEQDGITVTAVSAGKHKVEYASFAKLSDDARANLQKSVDATFDKFTDALKRNRGVSKDKVLSDFGGGRLLNASDALAVGLIDRVMTFDQLLSKLTGSTERSEKQPLAAIQVSVLRLRHLHKKRQEVE